MTLARWNELNFKKVFSGEFAFELEEIIVAPKARLERNVLVILFLGRFIRVKFFGTFVFWEGQRKRRKLFLRHRGQKCRKLQKKIEFLNNCFFPL